METTASERQPREGRQVSFLAKNKTKESDKKGHLTADGSDEKYSDVISDELSEF